MQTPVIMQDIQPECFTVAEPAEQLQAGFRNWWSRNLGIFVIVDGYANFIGSIGGIVLSIVLLAVWLVIGSVMGYSNDNWWLIIGTYTGLVSEAPRYMPDLLSFLMQLQQCANKHSQYLTVLSTRA